MTWNLFERRYQQVSRTFKPGVEALEQRLVPNSAPSVDDPGPQGYDEGSSISMWLSAIDMEDDPLNWTITGFRSD